MADRADAGATRGGRYTPAQAAHMFEEFLEYRVGHDEFWEWLLHFPSGSTPRDSAVEDVIDRAILSLQAFHDGRRSWNEVHGELMDCRSRLSGLARF